MGNCLTNCCYGCIYFAQQIHDNYIRDNRPVQIILGIIGGMLLMVILLAIFGAFRHHCAECEEPECFYNLYTERWPQTLCKELELLPTPINCIATLPKDLIIHGIQPQLASKQAHLLHCHDNPDHFDPALLAGIRTKLDTAWPAVETRPNVTQATENENLWRIQWNQHGSCTDLKLVDYFTKALELNTNYQFTKWLSDAGVKPSNTAIYTKDKFTSVLDSKVGKDQYLLRCVNVVVGQDANNQTIKQDWLLDISVCVQYSNVVKQTKCAMGVVTEPERLCPDKFYFVEDYKTHT